MAPISSLLCGCGCGEHLPPPARTGRPRRYIDNRHKDRARRSRLPSWAALGDELAEVPADPLTRRQRTIETLANFLEGASPAPAEDQLLQCLVDAGQMEFALRRLAAQVHPKLGGRAAQLAEDLHAALHRSFGELSP